MRRLLILACLLTLGASGSASAASSVTDQLTRSGTAVEVTSLPAGTDHVGVAEATALTGGTVKYGIKIAAKVGETYTPKTAGYQYVGMIADNAKGEGIGSWAPRLKTGEPAAESQRQKLEQELAAAQAQEAKIAAELATAQSLVSKLKGELAGLPPEETAAEREAREAKERAEREARERAEREAREREERERLEEPPYEEVPTEGAFHKGVDGGGWGLSNELADYKKLGSDPSVRLENPGNTSSLTGAGIFVVYLLNHYNTGGVKAINAAAYVKEAEAEAAQNPTDALEVLNEPGGNWFWGSGAESEANAKAYDALLKAVHEHVHVPIYGSFDGGHAGENGWGKEMLKADPNVVSYVTAFTEHPYDGKSANPSSTLVHWGAVEEAHRLTGKPVAITEYGRPLLESTGDSPKSTEAQQAAADGAMVRKAREVGWVPNVEIYGYRGNSAPCYAVFKENGEPRPAVAAVASG